MALADATAISYGTSLLTEDPEIFGGDLGWPGAERGQPGAVDQTGGVRKQYHFWPSDPGPGLDAWDVDRLILLSRDLPVHDVEVEAIGEVDTVYWFEATSPPTVRAVVEHFRLVEGVDPAYPVILSVDGRVMDGMHRIARALLQGKATVPAVRFGEPIAPDYRNCRPKDLPY